MAIIESERQIGSNLLQFLRAVEVSLQRPVEGSHNREARRGSGSPAMAVAAGSGALGWRGAPPPAARRPPHPGATPSPEDVVTSSPLDPVRRVGEGAHHGSMPWIWCEGGGRGLAVVGRERKRRAAGASRSRSKSREVGGCVRRKGRGENVTRGRG